MNNNENFEKTPAPDHDAELLRELMPKLGMEATEPGKKYLRKARMRYFLPRLAAIFAAAVLLVALCAYLFSPASFKQVSVTEKNGALTVDLELTRVLLLESVTAQLDGAPVTVDLVEPGRYQIVPEANGQLTISARTVTGRETVESVTVSAVDDQPPHVIRDVAENGQLTIYFADAGGAGIDWHSFQAADADTGESVDVELVDAQNGFVRLPFPDRSLRFSLSDKNGNALSVLLRMQPGGDGAEPSPDGGEAYPPRHRLTPPGPGRARPPADTHGLTSFDSIGRLRASLRPAHRPAEPSANDAKEIIGG